VGMGASADRIRPLLGLGSRAANPPPVERCSRKSRRSKVQGRRNVLLGGVEVDDWVVLRLAGAVQHRALSRKLSMACTFRSPVLNLTIAERYTILAILDDPPTGLEGLREHLLANQTWRLRERI
jgi:hypothetical protein